MTGAILVMFGCMSPPTLQPAPYTLHPTPYTLRPTPYIPHPTPYTLHPPPTPYTLHPAGAILVTFGCTFVSLNLPAAFSAVMAAVREHQVHPGVELRANLEELIFF